MIRAIRVKNFKSLRDVTLPFAEKVTVFVGANNSGKTNALRLLEFVAEIVNSRISGALTRLGGREAVQTRGTSSPLEVEIEAEFDQRRVTYGLRSGVRSIEDAEWLRGASFNLETGKEGDLPAFEERSVLRGEVGAAPQHYGMSDPGRPKPRPEIQALYEAVSGIGVYDLSVEAMRRPVVVQDRPRFGHDGAELAAVLDALSPGIRDAVDQEVAKAATDVHRVVTLPTGNQGFKVVGVYEKTGETYRADQISDGLLLFIGLSTALQMRKARRTIIAIEEPERGIHPRRLEQLVDQLWRLTENGTQVVLTTHSPLLLDQFRDYPESVVIFDRQGADTRVTRLVDQPAWKDALELDVRALGDIWYSGVLGGVPPP